MRINRVGLLIALCIILNELNCVVCYGKHSLKVGRFVGFAPSHAQIPYVHIPPYKTIVNARNKWDCLMECSSTTTCVAVDHFDQTCEFFNTPPVLSEDATLKHSLFIVRDILALNVAKTNITANTYTFSEATNVCQSRGTRLADPSELQTMYEWGYQLCRCGWASDAGSYLPYQIVEYNCGNSVGLYRCHTGFPHNAWCSFVYSD